MISNIFDKCSECGYKIPLTEQAYVFKGNIVCLKCDNKLREKTKKFEDISNKEYEIKDVVQKKGEEKRNVNNIDKANYQSLAEDKSENSDYISDLDLADSPYKEAETEEDYFNYSEELPAANLNSDNDKEVNYSTNIKSAVNSQTNCQQLNIRLPSFIHSCFIDRNFSTVGPQLKKKYRSVGGFIMLLSIVAILAVGAFLVKRYFLK